MQSPQSPHFYPFDRKLTDDDWDERLPCEKGPDCADPLCPAKANRDAMRFALGTMIEALQSVALVQAESMEFWGVCPTPDCTFEAQMQEHFTLAGDFTVEAFRALLEGISMWKALPGEWAKPERLAAKVAIDTLEGLNLEALRQAAARRAGNPDPRNPDLTPKQN